MRARAFAVAIAALASIGIARAAGEKIAPWLSSRLASGHPDSFIVLFDDDQSLGKAIGSARANSPSRHAIYDTLRLRARASQASVRDELKKAGIPYRSLYLINGLAVRGDLAFAMRLAARHEVVRIVGDPVVRGIDGDLLTPAPLALTAPEWGITQIDADKVWGLDGNHGEGIILASGDTGVEWTHPALQAKYRGWNGAVASHDYNWFDPIQDTAAPFDDYGHGTHTTGTMVGDGGPGNQVGVAPGARWIACRNMDHGNGQPSTYIACNQFFLAPYPHGGDPETDGDPTKAPDIVNNSWHCPASEGCDLFVLESSFAALRAARILAVAAATNSGPACSTVADPPALYDEVFAVGASSSTNTLASFSSRGPVTVDGSNRLRPDVDAPGVSVRSTTVGGTYGEMSGTSMAAPHVAGAAALLWSVKPQMRGLVGLTRCVMSQTARSVLQLPSPQTCGGTGPADRPNNFWGYGLIDAYDAIHGGPDTDGDGILDACDCAPADSTVYDVPIEVQDVAFAPDKTTVSWASLSHESGTGTIYDVIVGDLDDLRSGAGTDLATCLGSAGGTTMRADPTLPAPGHGIYYLIQARNTCGAGGFGVSSEGSPRTHASCP